MEPGTSPPVVGFIGFGEAGSTLARGLRSAGIERIFAYDVRAGDGAFGSRIQERAREAQTTIVDSSRKSPSGEFVEATDQCRRQAAFVERGRSLFEAGDLAAYIGSLARAVS